jgi:hypothetical protein
MVIVSFIVINQFVVWFLRVVFDDAFEQHYSQDNGRPSKPIRLMVGLLLLKQLENLSDERVVLQFKQFVVWFLRVDYLGMTEAEPQIISALSASGKAQNARESI